MLSAIHGDEFFRHCYNPLGEVMDAAALVNSAINFLLYCIMSKQFRRTFIETFNLQSCASCCERGHKRLCARGKQLSARDGADVNGNAPARHAHAHTHSRSPAPGALAVGAQLNGMGYTNKTIKEEDEAELTAMLAHPEGEEVRIEVATDETSPGVKPNAVAAAQGIDNGAMKESGDSRDENEDRVIDTQV